MSPLSITRAEAFEAFVGHSLFRWTLLVGDELRDEEDARNLPRLSDRDFEGYSRRVGAPFFLSLHDLEKSSPLISLKAREFVSGFPAPHHLYVGAFASNAKGPTPFGVHTDLYNNYTFVVQGRKRIRTWPREALEPFFPGLGRRARPGLMDYSPYLAGSRLLEGNEGDLLYWPDTHWHVGEGTGELSVTIVLGLEWARLAREDSPRLIRKSHPQQSRGTPIAAARLP